MAEALIYPLTLQDQPDALCVHFTAMKMTPAAIVAYSSSRPFNTSKSRVDNTSNMDVQGSICIALPSSTLTESFSSNWSVNNLTQAINDSTLGQGAQMLSGTMVPPVYKATYSSTEPREYSFSFSFLPKNAKETDECVKIIKTFKAWAAAGSLVSQSNESLMENVLPYVISMRFTQGAQKLDELIRPNYCVISSISVNYFDNGQITAYSDGMPKSTGLSLSLKEITVPLRGDFEVK